MVLPSASDRIVKRRNVSFGHVARLPDDTSVLVALSLSRYRLIQPGSAYILGRRRAEWIDLQLRRDDDAPLRTELISD